jgi:serine/threonine-protein kinase
MKTMGNSASREAVVKIGDVVEGRYRILKTLGQGGMGTVFLAEHALIKRRVAMKILHPDLATDADVIERFMNEARAAGTLGHPNIVESTDMGFTGNHVPYIVFEYLEGTLLTDEIYRVGGLPVRRTVRIADQIVSALGAAHNAGIVHRDLKSDNIFLTDKDDALDHVKVLDFGISRFLELDEKKRGLVMGTPEFMAPEQVTDPDNVDRRADIYALGVILYEMLTARRPFSNEDDPRQLLHRIVHKAPPPLMRPEVPHALDQMIMTKLLAKDPAARFQHMADVQAALEQFMSRGDGTPVPRRRTAPMVAVLPEDTDVSRNSDVIPKPSRVLATPVPGTLEHFGTEPTALDHIALPKTMPPAIASSKKPYALYAVAGLGVVVGAMGLIVGLKGSKAEKTAMTPPAPVVQPAPAVATQVPKEVAKIEVDLDADAPNSHVVFRRRVSAAPAHIQISATDVVELIEVSAPGFKTQRYWLTFDRPTHLRAHLVKGNGSLEATEEETLIALGEVAAPAQPAVAAAAPAPQVAATAKTVERTPAPAPAAKAIAPAPVAPAAAPPTEVAAATPAMAPRKIGRAAAEAQPAPAETPAAPAEVAATEPAPVAAPEVAPAPKDEPTVDPKPEQTMPVAKAEEPKAPPTLPDAVRPAIDKATVSSVIGQHRPEVLKCFADGKKKDHAMKGTLDLQLEVDTAGKVKHIQVQSTLNNPLVAACVVKSANAWKFPQRGGGDMATVNYPFTIN